MHTFVGCSNNVVCEDFSVFKPSGVPSMTISTICNRCQLLECGEAMWGWEHETSEGQKGLK